MALSRRPWSGRRRNTFSRHCLNQVLQLESLWVALLTDQLGRAAGTHTHARCSVSIWLNRGASMFFAGPSSWSDHSGLVRLSISQVVPWSCPSFHFQSCTVVLSIFPFLMLYRGLVHLSISQVVRFSCPSFHFSCCTVVLCIFPFRKLYSLSLIHI